MRRFARLIVILCPLLVACDDPKQALDTWVHAEAGSYGAAISPDGEHLLTGDRLSSAAVQTTAKVDLVEPMGSDTLIYATLGGTDVNIRMDGHSTVNPGDTIPVGLDPARASLFDPKTENRL